MEKTNKLTANQKEIIMQNPKVKAFDMEVTSLENVGRLAGVKLACLVFKADTDGTTAAMGLSSAADYLQQVRKYSKSQAMNLQRVGQFLKGDPSKAIDTNGNSLSLSAIVQMLESCKNEDQAHYFIENGTVSALTPVKKLKKQIDTLNGKAVVASADSKEVDDTADTTADTAADTSKTDTTDSNGKIPDDVYTVDFGVFAPDGMGGMVRVKSKNVKCKLCMVQSNIEKLLPFATAPNSKLIITVTPRK